VSAVQIADEPLTSADARALIAALDAELTERYPNPEDNFLSLDADEVSRGRGAFLVARTSARTAIGCGAVRLVEPAVAELKRMYVVPAWRGRRVGTDLLAALVERAGALGARRVVLEAGERQPEAIALYERTGFRRIPCFGPYAAAVNSVCMERVLEAQDRRSPT
jgi:GNAT superfamily N-acetyltransferase